MMPKEGSLLWYSHRLDDALFEGAEVTLREVVANLCEAALHHNVRDTALDAFLKYFSNLCQPADSTLPPSTYLCFKLLGARTLDDVMYHCCGSCGRHVWEHLPKHLWKDHADDSCPYEGCGSKRFKTVGQQQTLEPNKVSHH